MNPTQPQTPIKIFIVDDHPVIREGLRAFFAKQKRFRIVGEAADGTQGLQSIPQLSPDVVLMDIRMPGENGLSLIGKLKTTCPHARVLVVSVYDSRDYIVGAIQAGASGYILKDFYPSDLLDAIETVHAGKTYFPKHIVEKIGHEHIIESPENPAQSVPPLSKREKEVLRLVVEGQANKQIAQTLGISARTVETHREKIMAKLGIHSTSGLVRYALSTKLFDDL